MKRRWMLVPAALMLALTGCEDHAEEAAGIPKTAPSIRGEITHAGPSSIRVEENPGEDSGSAKAEVRLTSATRILRRDGTRTDSTELHAGQEVDVWFIGPVAESYPVQANGDVILIRSGDHVGVKE